MSKCVGCGWVLHREEERSRKLCVRCSAKLGIGTLSPSRRPAMPCRRCEHPTLVRAQLRERMHDDSYRQLAITYAVLRHEPAVNDDTQRFGALVAYVCRACGYTELYADRPEEIPIGAEFGTELVETSVGSSPFR